MLFKRVPPLGSNSQQINIEYAHNFPITNFQILVNHKAITESEPSNLVQLKQMTH